MAVANPLVLASRGTVGVLAGTPGRPWPPVGKDGGMDLGLQVANFTWPGGPESIGPTFGAIARNAESAGLKSLRSWFDSRGPHEMRR